MYDYINGKITKKKSDRISIEINGIGYLVFISLTTFQIIKESEERKIFIYLQHYENDMVLYGFAEEYERDIFKLIISISGIGPKLAIKILSGINPNNFSQAVAEKNIDLLKKIPGLGAKTAEKIIFELQNKIKLDKYLITNTDISGNTLLINDTRSALKNLGYKESEIQKTCNSVFSNSDITTIEQAIREALKIFSS